MPTARELRQKHPEFKWSSICYAGPGGFRWTYKGERDQETLEIAKIDGEWYVDRHYRAGQLVVTDRPEEYKSWSEYQTERMKELTCPEPSE